MNLPRFSVGNPVAVNLLMWSIILGGLYHWFTMVREFFPALDAEQISIIVPYPGATPEDVERAITLRIERKIRDIDGIDEIESAVYEGMSVILVKLDEGVDRDRVLNAIRSDIDQVKPEFPATADDPEIVDVRPYVPVISLVLAGDVPEGNLRDEALRVRDDLLDLGGISEISLIGLRNREIWAEVKPEKLEEHGLTFEEVGRVVAEANLDLPAGQLKSSSGNVRVRTMGESRRGLQLENIIVDARPDGTATRLRDVADVRDTFEDRVTRGGFSGRRAISLTIFKTPEQDALEIASKVKQYVAENPARFGGALTLQTTTDLSRLIAQRLDLMLRNATYGGILVVITLALFLSIRTAFWVALGLPIALLGAFIVMAWLGATINLLSLFALIVVLGLIVDDAVVIGEAVHGRIQAGMPPLEAAVKGANEMARPVVAAVLTSVIAFVPILFMGGIWGDFMGVLPIVVGSALLVSLVEAFVILPSHLGHMRVRPPGSPARAGPFGFFDRVGRARDQWLNRRMQDGLERVLRFMLRWRYPAVAASLGVLIAAAGLVAGGVVPFVLVQDVDAETVTVTLEMAAGTHEDDTHAVMTRIESMALQYPEVATVFSVLGTSFSNRGQETASDPATVGQLYFELLAADERELAGMRSAAAIIDEMRAATRVVPGVDKLSFRAENGTMQGADIQIRVRSESLATAARAADHVRDMLLEYDGVGEVERDLRDGKLEARLRLKDQARLLGLNTQDLALQLRHAVFGHEAQELQEDEDEIKVRVLLPEPARRDLADLDRLRVATDDGGRVPFEEVASLRTERGYATLKRVDGKRAVTVSAMVDDEKANVQEVTWDLQDRLSTIGREFPGVTISFEGEEKETKESFGVLALVGLPVAMFAIYALIAILFGSYVQPVIVMAIIPFSIVGAILGHVVMGYPLTLLSSIGIVALTGIVVNDSLILVDKVNRNHREEGMPLLEAVVHGARSRIRAIVLTTITTAAGLFPLLLERSFQAQFLIPMAISIVFGLVFATILTLLILPTFYIVFEDVRRLLRWLFIGAPKAAGVE